MVFLLLVILVESWDSFGALVKLFQCGGDIVWLPLGVGINQTASAECVKNVRDAPCPPAVDVC